MTAIETLVNHYATPLTPDVEGVYYFASPYTADDPAQTEIWVQEMRELKPRIIKAFPRIVPLVPVLETDPLADECEPEGGWYAYGISLLDAADGMSIVKQKGWQRSRGIMLELGFARGKGLPIATLDPDNVGSDLEVVVDGDSEVEHGITETEILEQMEQMKKADVGYENLSPEELRAKAIEILTDDIPF